MTDRTRTCERRDCPASTADGDRIFHIDGYALCADDRLAYLAHVELLEYLGDTGACEQPDYVPMGSTPWPLK